MRKIITGSCKVNNNALPYTEPAAAIRKELLRQLDGVFSTDKKFLNFSVFHHGLNCFIKAAHFAFDRHYPITLSPDMLWLLVCQGAAMHINQDPEAQRYKLVNFSGKEKIIVRRDDFVYGAPNPWNEVIPEFTGEVNKLLHTDLLQTFRPGFTTSGQNETLACEIAFLDGLSAFFALELRTMCGIPEIHLEGEKEDWKLFYKKLGELDRFDLQWWTEQVRPHIRKIIASYQKEEPDLQFWNGFYKTDLRSGGPFANGWIVDFFPYLKNPYKTEELIRNTFRPEGVTLSSLTNGLSRAAFEWNILFINKYPMEFVSGFLGVSQNPETFALRPEIGWAVYNTQNKLKGADFVKEQHVVY